jgi:hypothetical protein
MARWGRKAKKVFTPALNLAPQKQIKLTYRQDISKPAASVDLIKANSVNFQKRVAVSLQKQTEKGTGGLAWDVVALLDESYSMSNLFANGTVQEVTEAALAWTAGVDADGMAPVGGFANGHKWHGEVDLTNVTGIVQREGWTVWGGTDLTAGLRDAFEVAKGATNPVYLFIVTDGAPNDQRSATNLIKEMSQYPIFVKILLVGNDPNGKKFVEYLDNLEDHEPNGRLFDNVDAQHIADPSKVKDIAFFAEAMTEETDSAIEGMKTAGLVLSN